MTITPRDFDVSGTEARKMWHEIAGSGEDTVAVARASYEAGGKARHRLHSVGWLVFDIRFSSEAREFAVEVLEDRLSKVVEAAARALSWGWDVRYLSQMRDVAELQQGSARADIQAAINATEARNPDLFLDRTGGGRLHLHVADHNWREMRGGLIRCAQPRHAQTLLAITRSAATMKTTYIEREPSLVEEELRADIERNDCWIVGSPIAGHLVARAEKGRWLVKDVAVTPDGLDAGFYKQLLEFSEHEGRRRGFDRIFLSKCDDAAVGFDYVDLGYGPAERHEHGGFTASLLEKAL